MHRRIRLTIYLVMTPRPRIRLGATRACSMNRTIYLFMYRVYDEQRDKGIVFFVSAWINDVVRQKLPPEGVAIGKYFLPPSTAYWHGQRKCEPSRGPKAIHDPPPSTTEHRSDHSEQELQEARAGTVAPQGKELEARDMGVLWEELERSVEMVDIESESINSAQCPSIIFKFSPYKLWSMLISWSLIRYQSLTLCHSWEVTICSTGGNVSTFKHTKKSEH